MYSGQEFPSEKKRYASFRLIGQTTVLLLILTEKRRKNGVLLLTQSDSRARFTGEISRILAFLKKICYNVSNYSIYMSKRDFRGEKNEEKDTMYYADVHNAEHANVCFCL